MTEPSATGSTVTERAGRPLGLMAITGAVLCFSISSTLVKKAELPGPTLAFWRMVLATVVWWVILWFSEHRTITLAELRRAAIPGAAFGLNITAFFTGVSKTAVANAEFIGALTPLLVVPAGAFLFKERINLRALSFGFVSLAGLILVLFNAPPRGNATWTGNLIVVLAMVLWAVYLLTSRNLRTTMSVQAIMASAMPVAAVTILPIVAARGELDDASGDQWWYIVALAVLTGTVAHGFIVFAQRTVPVGTIGIIQVAQPALAVGWAYLLLDQSLRPIQIVGMVLVLAGLLTVVLVSRRATAGDQVAAAVATAESDR